MTHISSMPWVTCGQEKEFRLKRFISLEEINLSRQKQNYRFYLFDKSWYFPAKHVIYYFKFGVIYIFNCYTSKLKVKKNIHSRSGIFS